MVCLLEGTRDGDPFQEGTGMARTISIGNQYFDRIVENDYFYIDKTAFIKEWWESGDVVTLITRPRRFGKTLNTSMLECFFSNRYAGRSDLFERFAIWKETGYSKLQGTCPVLSLSFAYVKETDYRGARRKICQMLADLYEDHRFLLDSGMLGERTTRSTNTRPRRGCPTAAAPTSTTAARARCSTSRPPWV